jgi:hypothetical protein
MNDLKIRCSSLGKIMTNPRSKNEALSQTAKSYIEELAREHLFGIKKTFKSRYTDKGNTVEDLSIELVENVLDLSFISKNVEYFENDFIKGTPDVITDNLIIDVKSSWSGDTFPFFEKELPTIDYYYQVLGYMWLTGRRNAIVAYCLINTPEEIVNDEIRRTAWSKYEIEPSEETVRDVMALHNFDNIPKERRLKAFLVEYNESVIEKMKEKIIDCRKYFNELIG